ncbi:MAG: patatin family protein [Oscillospiraceae bacterium]|jgi:predicted patatin/cPLA2 family phospholipase|nr:patatin family protein [Oscillospiraceae bacterium]
MQFGWESLRSPKTGLLVEGGGQLAIYSVGALQYFFDANVKFPYYIGVSAAAANIVSHLAGHRNRTERFYTEYAKRPEYMGLKNFLKTRSFISLEYIYDTLTNHLDPVNYDVLLACQDEIRVVVTNALTGQAEYFDQSAFKERQCSALMASSALPVYCKPILIGGVPYYDGGVADSIPVAKALADGCERVVAVLNRPRGFQKKPEKGRQIYGLVLRKYPKIAEVLRIRHVRYMQSLQTLESLEAQGRAVIIRPDQTLPMNTFTRSPRETLEIVRLQGYNDAKRFCAEKR